MRKEDDLWTIQLREVHHHAGALSRVFGIVFSSTGQACGTIEFRGSTTSNLLALLQMSPSLRVVDCSHPAKRLNGTPAFTRP